MHTKSLYCLTFGCLAGALFLACGSSDSGRHRFGSGGAKLTGGATGTGGTAGPSNTSGGAGIGNVSGAGGSHPGGAQNTTAVAGTVSVGGAPTTGGMGGAPNALIPLSKQGHPVDWWFAFKFNAATFADCNGAQSCPFGGTVQSYGYGEGLQFAVASSDAPALQANTSCIGQKGANDPVGATFAQVYDGRYFYVLWNDQFYRDPDVAACNGQTSCSAPWGHSKGMVAWTEDGSGLVLQVSTPSWPASGSSSHPRLSDGNTLGCVSDDNVLVSQHFFSLRLTHGDLVKVLGALNNASVLTDPKNPQIVNNGGPADVQAAVSKLGQVSISVAYTKDVLSTGVTLISKPSALHVPPWQMVSAVLGSKPLRVATWWQGTSELPSTTSGTAVDCWDPSLDKPGAVEIATSGTWNGNAIGLKGGLGTDYNHAKVGVVTSTDSSSVVFGDLNQAGDLSGSRCAASQNGRGGLFFVVSDPALHTSVSALLAGESAAE